jgi:hypothetical protein
MPKPVGGTNEESLRDLEGRGAVQRMPDVPEAEGVQVPWWRKGINCFWGEGQGSIEREKVPGLRRISEQTLDRL